MKIRPLTGRVVVKSCDMGETTKSGIVLTSAAKEKPQISEVIAVGPSGIVAGNQVDVTVAVGEKVVTAKYSGTDIKIDGEEYTIINMEDILAVIE